MILLQIQFPMRDPESDTNDERDDANSGVVPDKERIGAEACETLGYSAADGVGEEEHRHNQTAHVCWGFCES